MSGDKKPCKGILKPSSSFDKEGHLSRTGDKEMKWDEMNILATYHPADKDYGHTKIDEPPTPYNKVGSESEGEGDDDTTLDAETLAARLGSDTERPKVMSKAESSGDEEEEEELTEEQKEKKRAFIKRRKMHYNEFQAVKLARQLIENEDDDDEEGDADERTSSSQPAPHETALSEATASSAGDTEPSDMLSEDLV